MKTRIFFLAMCFSVHVYAQKVTAIKKSEQIKGETAEGYSVQLDGKKDDVANAFSKFIKDLGKVKSGSDYQYVEGPAMGGTVYSTGIVYAQASGNDEKSSAWLGVKAAEWTANDVSTIEKQLEQLIYQFGVKFYRDKIQAQIDESLQAANAVTRQQSRLVNQNKDLNNKLVNNSQQKIQLEKSLEANKLENLVLLQKIENNKKSQDSVRMAGETIKKVIEMHKERQRKVN